MYLTLVILAGCPTRRHHQHVLSDVRPGYASAAQLVTLSTLLSMVTLPMVALLAQMVC